jgi:hypothetical protein
MKAALINAQGVVDNIIVWDESCSVPDGVTRVVVDDDYHVSVGYTYKQDGTFDAPPVVQIEYTYSQHRAAEYPPITDYLDGVVKGDQAQIDKYIADCQAVKAKYPKPE